LADLQELKKVRMSEQSKPRQRPFNIHTLHTKAISEVRSKTAKTFESNRDTTATKTTTATTTA